MIAGVIEIQMLANLAQLRQDMDRATSMVDSAMADISKAVNVAKFALGALAGVASVAAFKDMITGAIDAAEALHDLSIQTGASVESLSAMAKIGVTTDTSAQTIAGAMNKLAKNMAVASEESKGTGQALKALGIDFDTFRQMKPDDQMLVLAQAMGKFEDGSGKSAVAMTLLGKEGAKLLPFMADLAKAGELVATVTTEQARMADEYNDALSISGERVDDLKRQFALGLLPAMIDMLDLTQALGKKVGDYMGGSFKDARGEADLMGAAISVVGKVLEAGVSIVAAYSYTVKSFTREIAGSAVAFMELQKFNYSAALDIINKVKSDNAAAKEEFDKFQKSINGTTDRLMQARDAMRSSSVSSSENNREIASLGGRYGATALKVLDYKAAGDKAADADKASKAAMKELADQQDRQSATLLDLVGLSKDYGQKVRDLNDMVGKGTITHETYYLALDKLQAKTPASIQHAKDLAAAQKLANDEFDRAFEVMEKERLQIEKRIGAADGYLAKIQQETGDLKLSRGELALVTAERELERLGVMKGTEAYDAYIAKIRAAVVDKENTTAAIGEMKRIEDAAKATADNIEKGMIDSLFRAFESGKDFFSTLWGGIKNTFKTEILVPIIKDVLSPFAQAWRSIASQISNTVLTPMISAVTSGLGLGSYTGPAQAGGTGGGSNLASTASSIGSLFPAVGGWMSSAGAAVSGWLSGTAIGASSASAAGAGALATNAALIESAAAASAGTAAAGSTLMASIGAAAPYIAAAIAIVTLLSKKRGGAKTTGGFNSADFSGLAVDTGLDGNTMGGDVASLVGGVQSTYAGIAEALGGKAGKFGGAAFISQDPKGTALTQFVLDATLNGKEIYSRNNRSTGGNVEDVARDPAALAAAIDTASQQAVLRALQETNITPEIDAMIDAISASMTGDQIKSELAKVLQYKQGLDAAAAAANPQPSGTDGSGSGVGSGADYFSGVSSVQATSMVDSLASIDTKLDELAMLKTQVAALKADNTAENTSIAVLLKTVERILVRVSGGADNPGDALSVRAITP